MKTLKVLSALLCYPTEELVHATGELDAALTREGLLARPHHDAVHDLIAEIATRDLMDLQERYLLLFDRTRSLSLHLFEHVHGESRDRGQAMVDLLKVYEDGGFIPTARELPDFVPLFLEFAATRPPAEAIGLIAEPAHVFAALHERLRKRKSPYSAVFAALVALGRVQPDAEILSRLLAEPDPEPDDLEALDAAWTEEEVLFGPAAADQACGKGGLAARLRHVNRPAPGMTNAAPTGPRTTVTVSGKTQRTGA